MLKYTEQDCSGDSKEHKMIKRIISEKAIKELKEKSKFFKKKVTDLTDKELKEIIILLAKEHGILKNE